LVEVLPFIYGDDTEEEFGGSDGDGAGVADLAAGEEAVWNEAGGVSLEI